MSHSLAYDPQRYTLCFCCRSPAMTGAIHSKRNADTYYLGKLLKMVVNFISHTLVCIAFVGPRAGYYRKKIACHIFGILVQDKLHFSGPFYNKGLSRFASPVCHIPVLQIRFAQICHVDETHTSHIKTQHEHISGKIQSWIERKVKYLNLFNGRNSQSPFNGLVNTCINMTERILLLHNIFLYCSVIHSP